MTQAFYAHMNNKIKKKKKRRQLSTAKKIEITHLFTRNTFYGLINFDIFFLKKNRIVALM
jgi:hypothetical protein